MSVVDRYLTELEANLRQVGSAETRDHIDQAVSICADSIGAGKLVFTFGTGHGSFAAVEMFPRSGTCAGFRPIVESSLSSLQNLFGDRGVSQYIYLHTSEGFGKAIMDAHRFKEGDALVLFSHSGVNAVIIDMALEARRLGLKVIGVTSLPHSTLVNARHSSGLRLFEAADVVIDTHVPHGDASTTIDGFGPAVAPASTVIAGAIAHSIVAGTVEELVSRGVQPYVMINANTADAESASAHNARVLEEEWQRLRSR